MATYSKLADLLNTTDDMTVLRNNSAQDDGTDTVTGVDWFTFNGSPVTNLYVSGNSYVGFGTNAEHLKVGRRDCKMFYLYRQEGLIGNTKFLKIRWQGFAQYNYSSDPYALQWELFLFDDGGLFLNLVKVPTYSSHIGTCTLTCGSRTYSYTVEVGTPVAYSFLLQDDGTFVVIDEEYPVAQNRVPFGTAEFATDAVRVISSVKASYLDWDAEVPEGTSLKIYSKLSNGEYELCEKKAPIPGLSTGLNLSNETLFFKVEMSTEDTLYSPVLTRIRIQIFDRDDVNCIFLTFDPGNRNSIQRAAGDITVAYDGSGSIIGEGGPVLAFEHTFTPKELDPKNDPHDAEHIEIADIAAIGDLIQIRYINVDGNREHITLSNISAVGVLTRIDDI